MATISAFRGLRPPADRVTAVVAPPYDVLDSSEARSLAKGNQFSFLHVSKPEIDLEPGIDEYDERVYRKAKENFAGFVSSELYRRDDRRSLYIYRLSIGGHSQTGIVAGASVAEYEKGLIKKHELTRAAKEADRTKHTEYLGAQTGPVFLVYRRREAIDRLVGDVTVGRPDYDVTTYDGVRNEVWVVSNPDAIVHEFARVPALYIADGHHRAASYSKVGAARRDGNPGNRGDEEYNFFLSVIFPDNQMRIMGYNRVVGDLNGFTPERFLGRLGEKFVVTETAPPAPGKKHEISMYLGGIWRGLVPKPGTFSEHDPVAGLDVSILQENLLAPVLGIDDPRRSERIHFVGGIRGTGELEREVAKSGGTAVAFSLFPVSIDDLISIADAGRVMPPKSTWFEPKLKDGFVLKMMD